MVLPVYLYFVFALVERKNEIQKKKKYRFAVGWIADSYVVTFNSVLLVLQPDVGKSLLPSMLSSAEATAQWSGSAYRRVRLAPPHLRYVLRDYSGGYVIRVM